MYFIQKLYQTFAYILGTIQYSLLISYSIAIIFMNH